MADDSETLFSPCIPPIDIRPDIEALFSRARAAAQQSQPDADGLLRRQVVIVTPGRLLIAKECPIPPELPAESLKMLANLAPPQPPLNFAVIAYTFLEALKTDLRRAIPFIDYLLGFATLGHCVWVFEGHASALIAGCRDADVLLVDGGMLIDLEKNPDWQKAALKGMRGNQIKIIARPRSIVA